MCQTCQLLVKMLKENKLTFNGSLDESTAQHIANVLNETVDSTVSNVSYMVDQLRTNEYYISVSTVNNSTK